MNVRTFLRFLHPALTLLTTFTFCAGAASFGRILFGWSGSVPAFFAFATALPLLLGFNLANVAHEPMHRPFFLLLPNGHGRLLRTTAIAVVVLAGFVAGCVTLLDPQISPAASFGLAIALLALPSMERHRYANGLGGRLLAIVLWFALSYALSDHLRPLMTARPWLFFVLGISIASAALRYGFARRHLRERSGIFFVPPERMTLHVFDGPLRVRLADEQRRQMQARPQRSRRRGGDWPLRRVGASSREWMRVLVHASFGWRFGGSYLRQQLALATLVGVYAFGLPFFARLLGLLFGQPVRAGYWEMLAQLGGSVASQMSDDFGIAFGLLGFGSLLHPGIALMIAVLVARPPMPLPISRERLAQAVFGLSLLQWAMALAIPGTVVWLASLTGQLVSGQHQPLFGIGTMLGINLLLAFSLPLFACGGGFRHALVRIVWATAIGLGLATAVFLRDLWLPLALAPAGVGAGLLATAASLALRRAMLLRQYRTKDLHFAAGLWPAHAR